MVDTLLNEFGLRELVIICLLWNAANTSAIVKMLADLRHIKLESRLEDVEIKARHDIDMAQIRGEMSTQYHKIREELSDVGTMLQEQMKQQYENIINAITNIVNKNTD